MARVILTVGVSASGKTTWAEKFVQDNPEFVHLNSDEIRRSVWLQEFQTPFTWTEWMKHRYLETKVRNILREKQNIVIATNQSVVISNTHLNPKTRNSLLSKFSLAGYETALKLFYVTFAEAVSRDQRREYPVGYQAIAEQFIQWNKFVKKQYIPDISKPKAIIVDIDGTLTHIDGKRTPFEWDLVDQDTPNSVVIDLINRFKEDHVIILLTGREYLAQAKTEAWLNSHNIPYDQLIMRTSGDNRPGDIVKEEVFWTRLADFYHISFALEDTPKVVRMWQAINVPVFALGNQYIERSWYNFKQKKDYHAIKK